MVYSQDEKTKMDMLLQAFRSYVDHQEYYDVLYSRKAGYLRIITGDSCDPIYFPITGFADMVRMFTDDFLEDEEIRTGDCMKCDYDYVRGLLTPRLDALGPFRVEAYGIMEQTIEDFRTRDITRNA